MSNTQSWFTLPVFSLILLSFVLGTSEFIVVGILPDIASDLSISLTMAGNLISLFALAYAVGTPFITALCSPYNRYHVLLILAIIFILGNILCCVATNYTILISARIITAIVSGALLSISMTFSADIASPTNQPKVISWIFSGFSIASVFGVPIGTVVSQMFNWRLTFFFISAISLVVLLMLWHYLPNTGIGKKSNILQQFTLLKSPRIQLGMIMVITGAAASYVFYTYITPILQENLHLSTSAVSLFLSVFGIATIISNLLSGRIAGWGGLRKMPYAYFLQAICLASITFCTQFLIPGLINIFIMGVLMYLQNSPAQLHFLHTATLEKPEALSFASSLNPVSFNLGITIGSACGGLIVSSTEMVYVGVGGAVFSVIALITVISLLKIMASLKRRPHLFHR